MEGSPLISKQLAGQVQRFRSRRDAEWCVRELVKRCGVDIEEATPQQIVHEQTKSLWLDDAEYPDGLSIEQMDSGKRYLLVRDDGEEFTTDDLDENVADAIVRVLEKIKRRPTPKNAWNWNGRPMPTDMTIAMKFCTELHDKLSFALSDPVVVRSGVDRLLRQNSFRESCFCKGLVLPVVDTLSPNLLASRYNGTRIETHQALRCEGFDTPMYTCRATQVGFSSHSRSNSYHPGDKSGRRSSTRRSPDFCIRFRSDFRMLGEMKYVQRQWHRCRAIRGAQCRQSQMGRFNDRTCRELTAPLSVF
jgi:hypothetical protein